MKLYLVVRGDLRPGMRTAQLCHAHRAFLNEHPDVEREWFERSNTIVCLQADEESLEGLANRVERAGVPHAAFREPDLDGALTAIAVGPAGKPLCRHLHLVQ